MIDDNITFEHSIYNEDYYNNIGMPSSYILQIRKITKVFDYVLDFKYYSMTLYGFRHPQAIINLQKKFKCVYGYDINHYSILESNKQGLEQYVKQEDVSVPIKNPFPKTDISLCFYLMEHLTDRQNMELLKNMIYSSPIIILKMTSVNEPNYTEDETHINGKTPGEWKKFILDFVSKYGFKLLFVKQNLSIFIHESIYDSYHEKIQILRNLFKYKHYNLDDYKVTFKDKKLF